MPAPPDESVTMWCKTVIITEQAIQSIALFMIADCVRGNKTNKAKGKTRLVLAKMMMSLTRAIIKGRGVCRAYKGQFSP